MGLGAPPGAVPALPLTLAIPVPPAGGGAPSRAGPLGRAGTGLESAAAAARGGAQWRSGKIWFWLHVLGCVCVCTCWW